MRGRAVIAAIVVLVLGLAVGVYLGTRRSQSATRRPTAVARTASSRRRRPP